MSCRLRNESRLYIDYNDSLILTFIDVVNTSDPCSDTELYYHSFNNKRMMSFRDSNSVNISSEYHDNIHRQCNHSINILMTEEMHNDLRGIVFIKSEILQNDASCHSLPLRYYINSGKSSYHNCTTACTHVNDME